MSLLDARALIRLEHVKAAARLIDAHVEEDGGFAWLYEQTGRIAPHHRYVVIDGQRYPTKAFGFLAAQLASGSDSRENDMTVNEAYAPLKRLGYVEIASPVDGSSDVEEEQRRRSYYAAMARPEQAGFRRAMIDAYGGRCALSGVAALQALEAAHVEPFAARGKNSLVNGLLLRADLHRLFDFGQLAFDPVTLRARFSAGCAADYSALVDVKLMLPQGGPPEQAFQRRWEDAQG